jgi:hypothetical protein
LAVPIGVIVFTACSGLPSTGKAEGSGSLETKNPPDPQNCPGVESGLLQILQSENPIEAAEGRGYPTKDGKLQILLVLEKDDLEFLDSWDVEVGSGVGEQVQIFGRPGVICEIAHHENVLAVRLPQLGLPQ